MVVNCNEVLVPLAERMPCDPTDHPGVQPGIHSACQVGRCGPSKYRGAPGYLREAASLVDARTGTIPAWVPNISRTGRVSGNT